MIQVFRSLRPLFIALVGALVVSAGNAQASEPVRIQLWHQMLYSHRQVLKTVADDYMKLHPEVRIQLTYRETEELRSAYQSAAMGGSGPELIYGPSDQVGPFATMGIVRPLSDVMEEGFFSQFDPLAVVRFQGRPFMIGDMVGNHLMLIYNRNLLPEPPKDSDELIRMGRELTRDLNGDGKIDQYGLAWNFTEPFFFVPWVSGFGDWFFTEDNRPSVASKATIDAFRFIKSLRDEHKIIPRECDYEMANALFKEGKAAMLINGDWSWGDYQKAKVNFGIARIPMIKETGLWPSPLVGTKGYSLNVNIEREKLPHVVAFLKYLTGPEVQLRFAKDVSSLPSHLEARQDPVVTDNELLRASVDIMAVGRPMPVVPEIRAVWDTLRTQYQAVLGGKTEPEEAARLAQINAERQIRDMNEILEPNWQAKAFWAILLVVSGALAFTLARGFKPLLDGFFGKNRLAYLMMLPAFVGIFAVIVYPFFYNVAVSVSNFSLKTFHEWQVVGFQHYVAVLTDATFYSVLFKTVLWTVINLTFHVSLGVALALLINQTLPAKPLIRTLLIVPWAVPQYITALTWRSMFNQEYGSINMMLQHFLGMSPVQWLTDPLNTFAACIITNVWLGFPFMMVIALGGLQAIPQQMYEAARVDGANAWQRFWSITVPLLKPVMVPAITLGVIWTFNALNVIVLVSNNGEPADSTHILVSYVYKAAFNLYRYGYSAAFSMVIFLILLAFGLTFMNRSKANESMY